MRWKWTTVAARALVLAHRGPRLAAGQRVHADAQRGHAVLHADLAAGHVGHQGRRGAADAGQDHQELPEVASVFFARRAARRPRPTRRRPEMFETVINLKPQGQWRPGMTTDKLIAEMDRRCSSPASRTPGRCRSRRASTCCPPASARRSASRCSARPGQMERPAREIEAVVKAVPGTTSAYRRAHHRRQLPDVEPDRARWRATASASANCRTWSPPRWAARW